MGFFQSSERLDKVEIAFRKYDTNKDGYLSREEFHEVIQLDQEQEVLLNWPAFICFYGSVS